MTIMNKFFKSSILSSIVMGILGVLLIFQSEATIISISYIIGAILVAIGGAAIIKFIRDMNRNYKNELDIVYGVVTIILGILIITNPKAIASIIPFVVAIFIIITSATKLQYSFELKNNKNELWKSTMIISIITMLCGIILIFNPFSGAVFITKFIGIIILIYALLDMISTIRLRNTVIQIHSIIEDGIKEADIVEEKKTKKNAKKLSNKKDNIEGEENKNE